jgi:hydrogenase maturation protease
MKKVLLLGFGNPGRRDDGLGPALAEAVEKLGLEGVTVESDYQLTVEDAVAVAQHDVVLFADADTAGPGPFFFRPLTATAPAGFSSHSVEPPEVLGLAETLFARKPEAWLLGIRGYEFGHFDEGLTAPARANLAAALNFIEPLLKNCFEGSLNFQTALNAP